MEILVFSSLASFDSVLSYSLNTVLAFDTKGIEEAGKWNFMIAVAYYILTVVFCFTGNRKRVECCGC